MFKCEKCGSCCKQVSLNEAYHDLDRGDGICKYLDISSNLCTIYSTRPDICNINKMYKNVFKKYYSKNEYVELNKKYCKELRGE